eukprot:254938-Pyramimonas_sp.AAC.1
MTWLHCIRFGGRGKGMPYPRRTSRFGLSLLLLARTSCRLGSVIGPTWVMAAERSATQLMDIVCAKRGSFLLSSEEVARTDDLITSLAASTRAGYDPKTILGAENSTR